MNRPTIVRNENSWQTGFTNLIGAPLLRVIRSKIRHQLPMRVRRQLAELALAFRNEKDVVSHLHMSACAIFFSPSAVYCDIGYKPRRFPLPRLQTDTLRGNTVFYILERFSPPFEI